MASRETYTNYVERLRSKDPDVLLGDLVWYSVAEAVRVDHTELVAALDAVGLATFAPPEPRDDDVFRRVCSAHTRKRVETDDPEIFENYMMRDVVRDAGRVVKNIVVEQVDRRGEKLSHVASVALEFDSNGSRFEVQSLISPPNKQAMNLAELIRRDLRTEKGTVNGYAIRETLRRIVMSTGATVVRPTGGVYFVMAKHKDTVDALQTFCSTLDEVTFHPVPLINDEEQAAMLRDAVEAETRATLEKTLDEIDMLMAGPEIAASKFEEMVALMHGTTAKTREYAELLDDTLSGCDLLLKSYDAKMRKLFNHVKG